MKASPYSNPEDAAKADVVDSQTQGVTTRSVTLPDRINFLTPRKPRCNSTIDSRLSAAQADELFHRLEHGLSLSAAAEHLRDAHGIRLSCMSISRWAARRRRAKTELTLASLMESIAHDRRLAAALEPDGKTPPDLHRANELFASQALFAAQVNRSPHDVREATRLFVSVVNSLTRKRRLEAQANAAGLRLRKLALAAGRLRQDSACASAGRAGKAASADCACPEAGRLV